MKNKYVIWIETSEQIMIFLFFSFCSYFVVDFIISWNTVLASSVTAKLSTSSALLLFLQTNIFHQKNFTLFSLEWRQNMRNMSIDNNNSFCRPHRRRLLLVLLVLRLPLMLLSFNVFHFSNASNWTKFKIIPETKLRFVIEINHLADCHQIFDECQSGNVIRIYSQLRTFAPIHNERKKITFAIVERTKYTKFRY